MAATCLLAGAAVWLLTRRYSGIHNDAALYTLMALAWRDPATFASDLFVRFGSQDPFTLFSPLYGFLIGALGLKAANIGLTFAAHAVWLTGAWMLTRRMLRGPPALIGFLLLTAVSAYYGGWAVLYAGEAILTPRPLAEGLVMIALALLMGRAWLRSTAIMLLAALIHPAMALAGLGAAFGLLALRRRLFWWAAPAGVAAVLALAAAGAPPFGRLFQIMDGPWLAGVTGHDGFVFAGSWMAADWVRVAAELAICGAAAVWSGGDRRRVYIAVSASALGGLVVSVIGADLARDVLIVQLQTWRLCWLLAVVSLPAIVLVALRLRRRRLGLAASALLAAPLIILTRPFSDKAWAWGAALAMSLAGLALAVLIRRGRQPALSRTANRMIIEAAVILPLGALGDSAINAGQDVAFWFRHHTFSLDPAMFIIVRMVLLAAAVGLVLMSRRRPAIALTGAVAGVLVAALVWDARPPWDRYLIDGGPGPLTLPAGATVLWADEASPTWFLLRRPAYVSQTQAAGLLFSRATSQEWRRRADIVRPLVTLDDWSPRSRSPTCAARLAPVALSAVAGVCARAAGLTGVVLDRPVVGGGGATVFSQTPEPIACTTGDRLDIRRIQRLTYLPCAGLAPH
jgi:hypothetical protein